MQTAKISEIFQSIQGEGKYAGARQVFLRFFGCHMHCSWCDTPESIGDTTRNYKEMTLTEVFAQVKSLYADCHSVSLTGGEPLLQVDFISQLLPLFKKAKMSAYLETSGVLHKALAQVIKGVDVVSMDIKMPSSTGERAFWKEHEKFLDVILQSKKDFFIKAVVSSNTEKADILKTAKILSAAKKDALFILQPNTFDLSKGVVQKCDDFQRMCFKILPNTRVMPQMHKFMKIR
jgi:7-carboxy-7-deazaguanine synthase